MKVSLARELRSFGLLEGLWLMCVQKLALVFFRHVRARGDWTHAAKLDRDDRIPAMYNAVALKDDDKEKLEVAI
ncbi:unnamed protein product [Sphagnum compactum]